MQEEDPLNDDGTTQPTTTAKTQEEIEAAEVFRAYQLLRERFDAATFSYYNLVLALGYWAIVMFIGPTLQLPYDIYKRTCGHSPGNFYASKSRILKRSLIHTLMMSVGFVVWSLLRYYKQETNPVFMAEYTQWWYFLFESFAFLIIFPMILLAVILSCKYAVIDENEYHQMRLILLLENREIIERILEDVDA